MALKPNAQRMQDAVAFVTENPGITMRSVILHVLGTFDETKREKAASDNAASSRLYKQAASVVERIIKDRHVCQRHIPGPAVALFPWDAKLKAHAENLERARHSAPSIQEKELLTRMTCQAWRAAGDENRALTIELLEKKCHA